MRIDEIQGPVEDIDFLTGLPEIVKEAFEKLDRQSGVLYLKKFPHTVFLFASGSEHHGIESPWQKMEKRKMGENAAPADLLMPSERHLPCRERHEHYPVGLEITGKPREKATLVSDVLKHVVTDDEIEGLFQLPESKDVRVDETPFRTGFIEEAPRVGYLSRREVNSCDPAPHACEREQVAAFSTADFKNIHPALYTSERGEIRDEMSLTCVCKFTEIPCPVCLPCLHLDIGVRKRSLAETLMQSLGLRLIPRLSEQGKHIFLIGLYSRLIERIDAKDIGAYAA